ncbi:MAG: DUF4124 domain-containing protein [Pseudomonadota bacterium]
MKTSFEVLLIAVLLSVALTATAEDAIYKTVDEDGNVVYTDQRPSTDAEPLDLPELTVVDPVEIGTAAPQATEAAEAPPPMELRIVSPLQDETIWNTGYTVDVQLDLTTVMPAGGEIHLFVDGEHKATTRALSTTLNEVFRGPHTMYAELRDGGGQVLATSDPVRFIIQQQSALRNRPG